LIENVPGGSIRNVFFLYNIFLMMGTHNKTSHATEDKNMVRIPFQALVPLRLTMLVRVQPFVVALQEGLFRKSAAVNTRRYLYRGVHGPMTTQDLSEAMATETERLLSIRLTLRDWRHITSWFIKENSSLFEATEGSTSVAHLGFGHTAEISRREYAKDDRLPEGVDKMMFFATAKEWCCLADDVGSWRDAV
jgi:hypothetical protein